MFALVRLAEGLIVVHLFIAAAFLIGANAMEWARRKAATAPDRMIHMLCASGIGFAFIGFGAFVIASLGLLRPAAVVLMAAALFAIGCAAAKSSPFRAAYWRSRWELVFDAFDAPNLVLYYAMLIVSVPAVNLVNGGSDALAFHWAYAMDWIHAHGLTVDPFLREPFYAQNDLLDVTILMLFGGASLVQFLMWAFGVLTALAVCAGVRAAFRESGPWQNCIAILLALAVVYSPTYLRWMDSGYLDVVLGCFALLSVLALQQAAREEGDWRWIGASAVLAAFLIGSKSSFLPFVFVYGAAFLYVGRLRQCSFKQCAGVLVMLVILSAPWYVRNLVLAGDVIAPVLNITLHGNDGLFTKQDVQRVAADLHTNHDPSSIATLPWRAFFVPYTWDFREYAQDGLMLLLYLPTAVLLFVRVILHRKVPPTIAVPVALLTVMILYWIFSSTVMRYCLLFFPLLALCVGLVAASVRLRSRYTAPVLAVLAAALLVFTPTAQARDFYSQFFINGVENPPKYYSADQPFLMKFVDGYAEEQFTSDVYHRLHLGGRVYVIANYINYYYRRDGIESIGDWVGPAGLMRLYEALDAGQAADFLRSFDVDAVLIDPQHVMSGLDTPLERQIEGAGYCALTIPSSRMLLLVRSGASCKQIRSQLR